MGKNDRGDLLEPELGGNFGLERKGLEDWQRSRLTKVLGLEHNRAIVDCFGDKKLGIYGGVAVLITTNMIRPEATPLGWEFFDLLGGELPDTDWAMDFGGQNAVQLVGRLGRQIDGRYRVLVEEGGGYGRIEVERVEDGVRVASVSDIVKSADFVRKVRASVGQAVTSAGDWEDYIEGSMFDTWGAVMFEERKWQNLAFKSKAGALVEVNPTTIVQAGVYDELVKGRADLANQIAREFLGWMGRLMLIESYGVGFGTYGKSAEWLRGQLAYFRQKTNNYSGGDFDRTRAGLAERIVRGVAFDVDGIRHTLIKTGVMSVFSPTLGVRLDELNQAGNGRRHKNLMDLLSERSREGQLDNINDFFVALAEGVELSDEEFLRMVVELETSWCPRPLAGVAVWMDKRLSKISVNGGYLRNARIGGGKFLEK